MQRDRCAVARTWLDNSSEDLAVARELLERHPARATFHAQQAAEMALNAAMIARIDDHPLSHSAGKLVAALVAEGVEIPATIASDAASLDLYYLGSRYPDAVGDGDPVRMVPREDAERSIYRAERVSRYAGELVAAQCEGSND